MVAINQENPNTIMAKLNAIRINPSPMKRRTYLGMSGTAHKCMRNLQYGFRWASPQEELTFRKRRIFERGDIEEARVIRDLKSIGVECYAIIDGERVEITGAIGEKQEEIVGFAGHVKGHTDGRCINVPEAPKTEHRLEIKTAKASKWKIFKTKGCKATSITYYGQTQSYMGDSGITRTLFIVVNKDTEEWYVERIKFDKDFYDDLKRKEMMVITTENLFDKLIGFDVKMNCTWCNNKDVCKNGADVQVNCRTCSSGEVHNDGKWKCAHDVDVNKFLSKEEQISACNIYEVAKWLL